MKIHFFLKNKGIEVFKLVYKLNQLLNVQNTALYGLFRPNNHVRKTCYYCKVRKISNFQDRMRVSETSFAFITFFIRFKIEMNNKNCFFFNFFKNLDFRIKLSTKLNYLP